MVSRVSVVLALLPAPFAIAQEAPVAVAEAPSPGKAIRFEFNGLNLNGIDGGIGGKWWTSPHTALTASLGFRNHNSSENPVDTDQRPSTESVRSGVSVSVGLEQHMRRIRGVSPYVGFLLGSSIEWQEHTTTFHFDENPRRAKDSITSYSVRTGMSLGLEYFVADSISLAGDYSFILARSSGIHEVSDYGATIESDVSSSMVGLETSRLMLSVYFQAGSCWDSVSHGARELCRTRIVSLP